MLVLFANVIFFAAKAKFQVKIAGQCPVLGRVGFVRSGADRELSGRDLAVGSLPHELQQHAFGGFAGGGPHGGPAACEECSPAYPLEARRFVGGEHHREAALLGQQPHDRVAQRLERQLHGMACRRALRIGRGERIDEKGGIGDDQVVAPIGPERLHGASDELHPVAPGRCGRIFACLADVADIDSGDADAPDRPVGSPVSGIVRRSVGGFVRRVAGRPVGCPVGGFVRCVAGCLSACPVGGFVRRAAGRPVGCPVSGIVRSPVDDPLFRPAGCPVCSGKRLLGRNRRLYGAAGVVRGAGRAGGGSIAGNGGVVGAERMAVRTTGEGGWPGQPDVQPHRPPFRSLPSAGPASGRSAPCPCRYPESAGRRASDPPRRLSARRRSRPSSGTDPGKS